MYITITPNKGGVLKSVISYGYYTPATRVLLDNAARLIRVKEDMDVLDIDFDLGQQHVSEEVTSSRFTDPRRKSTV